MGGNGGEVTAQLRACVAEQLTPALLTHYQQLLQSAPDNALLGATAAAPRKAGRQHVSLSDSLVQGLQKHHLWLPAPLPLPFLVRAWLLAEACSTRTADEQLALITRALHTGDSDERCVVLRLLPALPSPERYLSVAIDACRSNVLSVLQALACDNPYPARYFPEPSFNQLVMKSLFMGSPLACMQGLAERVTPELLRMARDYAAERRAARRPLPSDLMLLDPQLETDA